MLALVGCAQRTTGQTGAPYWPKIREHHGRIVKTTGDGVLAEFASVVDAVRCAGEIQRAMANRDLDLAEERRLRFLRRGRTNGSRRIYANWWRELRAPPTL
jgi:hypothetical protein